MRNDWSDYQRKVRLDYKIINKSDYSMITISNPKFLKLKSIMISAAGNFRREYQISDNPEMKQIIKTGEIYNLKFQDLNISGTSIDFSNNPFSSSMLKLKIFNHDNPALKIKNLQCEYFIDQIVFEEQGNQNYRLFFGNPEAKPPIYDLESYKNHILKEPMNLVALQDFTITKAIPIQSKLNLNLILNIVIVSITLLLIIFIVRKLNIQSGADK